MQGKGAEGKLLLVCLSSPSLSPPSPLIFFSLLFLFFVPELQIRHSNYIIYMKYMQMRDTKLSLDFIQEVIMEATLYASLP